MRWDLVRQWSGCARWRAFGQAMERLCVLAAMRCRKRAACVRWRAHLRELHAPELQPAFAHGGLLGDLCHDGLSGFALACEGRFGAADFRPLFLLAWPTGCS